MTLDWKEYENLARQAVREGVVLLKNEKEVLPLKRDCKLAVFGRMQNNYYKSGTGSGGMVNVPRVWGILDGLKEEKMQLDETLLELYEEFEKEHPFDAGVGFGNEPWSQEEMEVSTQLVSEAATRSEVALVIIGRTAGEEQDYVNERGAYRLSEKEADLLSKVRSAFDKVVLVMNVSAVLDMQEIDQIAPDAVLYAWQGGEIGGLGCVDVLLGKESPSGHLTDTIVRKIEDAPAYGNFGDLERNFYVEDIYVGYRYYETFHKDAVMYPFGFGLSYTTFALSDEGMKLQDGAGQAIDTVNDPTDKILLSASVKNTGKAAGKEVVQFYVSKPQGALGKPAISLVGFAKTDTLQPGESCSLSVEIPACTFASYDESGAAGFESCYVLEGGEYVFYAGQNVRSLTKAGSFLLRETILMEKLSRQMAPQVEFDRIKAVWSEADEAYVKETEKVKAFPLTDLEEAKADRPECKAYTGDQGIKLKDVRDGKADMADFLAQLSDEDLSVIIRGEGMGSPKVTPGTAAAFGGVSPRLKELGIPAGCCSDGPSGMRLDSGSRAFSLPNGTLLACTWNTRLNTELYSRLGMEMNKNNVDFLLGPGMNVHRHPLNGRNFEYFSEDPLVTGKIAAAQIRGLKQSGVSGTLKHFCGNNQETNRHGEENVISERALREIYLKGFEIAVKEANADSVMTTYGPVNGIWTNSRHDLSTNILRKEWGFKGIVMTDWWANIGDVGKTVDKTSFSRLVLAQNDFFAVCPDATVNATGDDTLEALEKGVITRGQLVRGAENICSVLMTTNAMKRLCGEPYKVEVTGYEEQEESFDPSDVTYIEIKDGTVIDLSEVNTKKGAIFFLGFDVQKRGCYFIDMVGSSDLSELAQIPVGVYFQGIPGGAFTFHGGGQELTVRRKILFSSRYGVMRLRFMNGGLNLKEMRFTFEKDIDPKNPWADLEGYIYG
ncbi:MAG: glycoside hydrolase family 3 C-terminal domain-containing protein [Lachnospiraceae bacterium]|nr:glycoside hydrolase family 3 C-terminal domain-containing protein [Lachnospiraceae bacterium]